MGRSPGSDCPELEAPGTTAKPPAATTMASGANEEPQAGDDLKNWGEELTGEEVVDEFADDSDFEEAHRDENGFITAEELKQYLQVTMGEEETDEEVDGEIRRADADNDGQINFEEFAEMWEAEGLGPDQVERDLGDADESLGGDSEEHEHVEGGQLDKDKVDLEGFEEALGGSSREAGQ